MGANGSKNGIPRKKYKNHLIQSLDDHDGGVNCMALSEDGSVLATGRSGGLACALNQPRTLFNIFTFMPWFSSSRTMGSAVT